MGAGLWLVCMSGVCVSRSARVNVNNSPKTSDITFQAQLRTPRTKTQLDGSFDLSALLFVAILGAFFSLSTEQILFLLHVCEVKMLRCFNGHLATVSETGQRPTLWKPQLPLLDSLRGRRHGRVCPACLDFSINNSLCSSLLKMAPALICICHCNGPTKINQVGNAHIQVRSNNGERLIKIRNGTAEDKHPVTLLRGVLTGQETE